MYFSTAIIASFAALTVASPIGARDNVETREVVTRGTAATIATGVASGAIVNALVAIAKEAIEASNNLINNINNFDEARETFARATTEKMFAANPDPAKFPAVICYNQGYDLQNPAGIDGRVSVEVKSGPLHTDYDCMYMTAANAFFTRGDGGKINLSTTFDTSRCSFNSNTSDLRCN